MASSRPVQSVSNTELYDRWAKVYDTDGNILQSIDDHELAPLLTQAFSLLSNNEIHITELGCGTGRNTVKLVQDPYGPKIKSITALDLSKSMLAIASSNLSQINKEDNNNTTVEFKQYDALASPPPPVTEIQSSPANLVLSTLVLEHLPLDIFFQTVKSFLDPQNGGLVVLTNMHADMGRQSQAGFVDTETGEKIRGTSFVYEIEEVVEEAKRCGFEMLGEMRERMIDEEDVKSGLVGDRGRKWIGVNVWFGCVLEWRGV